MVYKTSCLDVNLHAIMLVAGSRSVQMRDVRVTLRSVKRDVRSVNHDINVMTYKLDEVTAHLETLTVKLDRQNTLMRKGFCVVIIMLGLMSYHIESTWWMMATRKLTHM